MRSYHLRMNSNVMMRRLFFASPVTNVFSRSFVCAKAVFASNKKKPLVFLGSPEVSAAVLDALFDASETPDSIFEVAAIVTQPPSKRGRGRKLLNSPVAQLALDRGFSSDLIFTPERANEDNFLSSLKDLKPEVCVTAAYGNILPTKFLKIPLMGTVNIHPSLLPLYRGAAPVQRALQNNAKETGVCLAYTVRALDAGPIIACEKIQVDDHIKAPDLLELLFSLGSKLLIKELPFIFDGSAKERAQPQDDSNATLAPKLTSDESLLSFDDEAIHLHNKVRAFAGWPGTRATLAIVNDEDGSQETVAVKIVSTRVGPRGASDVAISFSNGSLKIPCGNGDTLEVLELQLPGKNVVNAAAFWNGLRGKRLTKV